MTDPTQAGQQEPSEEEVQQYLEQLREAESSDVLAQAFNMLATGAQVKLGRSDARLLIDALSAISEAVADQLSEQFGQQMRSSVSQLQSAQVQAEQQAGDEPAGAASAPQGSQAASQGSQQAEGGDQRLTDRLWVPGQ
jgi:hypothetical protein